MKTCVFLAAAALLLPAAALARGNEELQGVNVGGPSDRVQIVYDHPENFTDIKDEYAPTDRGEVWLLQQLSDFIVKRSNQYLPSGYRVKFVFTDITYAGEFEPWRGPRWEYDRVAKSTFPPKFQFTYTIWDPAGNVVKQARASVTDLDYTQLLVPAYVAQDPLPYERTVLGNWLDDHLKGLK